LRAFASKTNLHHFQRPRETGTRAPYRMISVRTISTPAFPPSSTPWSSPRAPRPKYLGITITYAFEQLSGQIFEAPAYFVMAGLVPAIHAVISQHSFAASATSRPALIKRSFGEFFSRLATVRGAKLRGWPGQPPDHGPGHDCGPICSGIWFDYFEQTFTITCLTGVDQMCQVFHVASARGDHGRSSWCGRRGTEASVGSG
jgi:hypothetical protein